MHQQYLATFQFCCSNNNNKSKQSNVECCELFEKYEWKKKYKYRKKTSLLVHVMVTFDCEN